MARHCVRRASSGWDDCRVTLGEDEEVELFGEGDVRPRRERRVSWRPGAEGAEFSGRVWEAWGFGGMKRRDWAVS